MKKVVGGLFALLFILIISTVLAIAYKDLKPQKQTARSPQPKTANVQPKEIDFINLESTLLNEDGTYFLWFCDSEDNNCAYVENEFITPILNKLDIEEFENMHKICFTDCPFSKQRLKEKYNVESKLAFVKVEVYEDEITYSDGISWTEEDSFSFDDLEKWLYDHNIWQKAYSKESN